MHILIMNHIHQMLNRLGKYNVEVDSILSQTGILGCRHVCAAYKPNKTYGNTKIRTTTNVRMKISVIIIHAIP